MRVPLLLTMTLTVAAVPAFQSTQTPAPASSALVDSYTRAAAIVDAAVAAHGGTSALTGLDKSRIVLDGNRLHRYQGRRPDPPYDQESDRLELLIDLPNAQLVQTRWTGFPGGIRRHSAFITDGPRGFFVDFRTGRHSVSSYPAASTQTGNLYYLPQYVVRDLQSQRNALRYLGRMRLQTGEDVDVVTGATSSGPGTVTAAFDPTTRLLRATLSPTTDTFDGDVTSEIQFVDYRTVNGVLVPRRRVSYLGDLVVRDLTLVEVEPGHQMPASALVPPAASVPAANRPSTPTQLAPGVWTVGGVSALVVAFNDHVMVVDAPTASSNIISQIKTLAPGKPIRYVAPTHHHDDHSGGVRHFVAAGATVITTAGNRAYLERMARSVAPPMEVLTSDRRVFSDGRRTVELHNIGAGPHAQDMLVAWIPEEGILFQADLIDSDTDGWLGPGANNETTMHFAAWLKGKNWPVKVFAGAHGSLASPEAFDALIKMPIKPLR